uniref:Uncharacterized protein n=1 Tax=Leersia perrieri TaxID=77586 RepID=A0A0D9VN97_9ORYZ
MTTVKQRANAHLPPKVMSTSGRLTIGFVGYGRVGKSTLLQALLNNKIDLSKRKTHPTSELHVVSAHIYKCSFPNTPCYRSRVNGNVVPALCGFPGHELNSMVLSRDVSFVDCPGEVQFASTMLGALCLVDVIFILSTATGVFTQSPSFELLAAANILGKKVVVIQSMIDSTNETRGMQCIEPLIIPISAWNRTNINEVCKVISDISVEEYDDHSPVGMLIYSNCTEVDQESGDTILTIYGRLLKGTFKQNQRLEIRPGAVSLDEDGRPKCNPIIIELTSLESEGGMPTSGSLISVKAAINYDLVGNLVTDMTGYISGDVGSLPDVFSALEIKVSLLPFMFNPYTEELEVTSKILENEKLLMTIGMLSTSATVRKVMDNAVIDFAIH